MTISLDLSTSLASGFDIQPRQLTAADIQLSAIHWDDWESYSRGTVDRLSAALKGWMGLGPMPPVARVAMGSVSVTSFGDLAAGRLEAASLPSLDLHNLAPLTSFTWPQVAVFGRYGWALDLPLRSRRIAIHAEGLELELDAEESRTLAAAIDFHVRHAGSREEREAWWCAVGRPGLD
jgi:hypothetical protein